MASDLLLGTDPSMQVLIPGASAAWRAVFPTGRMRVGAGQRVPADLQAVDVAEPQAGRAHQLPRHTWLPASR